MREVLLWIGVSYLIVSLTVGLLWVTANWRRNDPARIFFHRVGTAVRRRLPWTPPAIRPLTAPRLDDAPRQTRATGRQSKFRG